MSETPLRRGEYSVHRPPRSLRMAATVFTVIDVGVFLFAFAAVRDGGLPGGTVALDVALVVVSAVLAYGAYHYSLSDGLIAARDGLRCYVQGARGRTDWDNLQGFDSLQRGPVRVWGVRLREPIDFHRGLLTPLLTLNTVRPDFIPLSIIVPIPTETDDGIPEIRMGLFRQSRLGKELLHYAPHVFEVPRTMDNYTPAK